MGQTKLLTSVVDEQLSELGPAPSSQLSWRASKFQAVACECFRRSVYLSQWCTQPKASLRAASSKCAPNYEANATPLLKQGASELTHAHTQHTVVLTSLAVRVRRVYVVLSGKQSDIHAISQILVKPKFYTSDFALYRPIYGNMVKSNIIAVKFSQFYPLGILVGYLAAIYACFLGVPKKLIFFKKNQVYCRSVDTVFKQVSELKCS